MENITDWLANITDDDWRVRWKAVEQLGKCSERRTIKPLLQALQDRDWSVRLKAVESLGLKQDKQIAAPLVAMLTDTNKDVRKAAFSVLMMSGAEVIEPLIKLLETQNAGIRKNVVALLGKFHNDQVIEALTKTLEDPDMNVRKKVADMLKAIGSPAVSYLSKALDSHDSDVQWRAVKTLGEIGDCRAIEALVKTLEDDDAEVRLKIVEVLERLGWEPQTDRERIWNDIARRQWDSLTLLGAQAITPLLSMLGAHEDFIRHDVNVTLERLLNSVEVLVFGDISGIDIDPKKGLHNIDVSQLTLPMRALKRLLIDTHTYNFHHVERFMTYAVNYIGQEYLKEQFEVNIYGDPDKLHPNLKNTVTNLCRDVYIHK